MFPLMGIGAGLSGLGALGSLFGKNDSQDHFDDMISFARRREKRMAAMLQGVGAQERADVNTRWDNALTGLNQDAISRGITGTTIPGDRALTANRERGADLRRVDEGIAKLKAGAYQQTSGDTLSALGSYQPVQQNYGGFEGFGSQLGALGYMMQGNDKNPYSMNDWMTGKGV